MSLLDSIKRKWGTHTQCNLSIIDYRQSRSYCSPRVFLESIRRLSLSLHTFLISHWLLSSLCVCLSFLLSLSLVCLLWRRRRLNLSTTPSTSSPRPSARLYKYFLCWDLTKQIPVACSTTTVTKCQAGLRTLQTFPVFHPTCLCREPSVDPDCNAFRDSLFDHPCMVATQKGKLPYIILL